MPLIRPEEIYASTKVPWHLAEEAIATAAVAQYDIVVVDGRSGFLQKVSKADASVVGTTAGALYVALGAAALGAKLQIVPWIILTAVDTSASAAAGSPVYLSETAGGWTATAPDAEGTVVLAVGEVLEDHATTGVVKLAPGHAGVVAGEMVSRLSTNVLTDPAAGGAIAVTTSGVCAIETAAGEVRTIAAPSFLGQRLVICLRTDGGDATVNIATAFNQTGNNRIVFADAGDFAEFVAIKHGANLRWRLVANDGGTLSTA